MIGSRRRTLLVVTGVAVVSLALGFLGARQIQSPAERAALAAAPEREAITVPIEEQQLVSEVVTRGDAVFDGAIEVQVETGGLATPAVVTGGVLASGDTIEEGAVLLEITGRPVLALVGEIPTYRTLTPGTSGPDVEQLELALERLALDTGDATDGLYDDATAAAVGELYRAAGYEPPSTAGGLEQEVAAAEDAVDAAEETLTTARVALADARGGPSGSARLSAEAQVDQARRALDQARRDHADHADDVARADEDLARAHDELAAAEEAVAESEDADPAAQQAARDRRDAARAAVTEAEAHAEELAARDTAGEVQDAEAQLAIAEASLQELLAPADAGAAADAVARAEEDLADARADLADLRAAAGTPAPAAEIVFLPTLPRHVDAVEVERGSMVEGPVMTVSGADLVVVARLGDDDAQFVREGMDVVLDGGDLELEATITKLRTPAGDTGLEAVLTPTDLAPEDVPALRGRNVKVTIPIEATDGTVLTVPLAALTAGPDGDSRVEVQRGDTTELVDVEVGLAAGGHAEIRPVDGDLQPGDRVVVGE